MIACILINRAVKKLNKVYDYLVKEEDLSKVEIGKRVKVSFGRGKDSFEEGIIVKLKDDKETPKFKLKYIEEILDDVSYIDASKLKLAKWMSYMYFCNVYDVLKLMLPPGTNSIDAKKELGPKKESVIFLKKSMEEIENDIEERKIKSAKQINVLRFLEQNEYVTLRDVLDGLNITKSVIDNLVKSSYVKIEKVEIEDENILEADVTKDEKKNPTKEQKNAIDKINEYVNKGENKKILLFGVTGSGKTEVYLQCIENVLNKGKNVVVLVPEISLTHQTITRFIARFGNCVSMIHSKMTISMRKEEYRKIKSGKVRIVIGARSAIFAPLDNIGMIIIDEEHDSSYYSQMTPKYSTKEVAAYIAKNENAVLLLGSATPEVSTYYKAQNGQIECIEMTKRPGDVKMPQIIMVDKKNEALRGKEDSVISKRLETEILNNKKNGEQSIIFLNRRGYSSYIFCKDCKNPIKCPNCDVTLTYHKNNNLLTCHYCGFVSKKVELCPNCGSKSICENTFGTEKIEEKIKNIDENISVIRMDKDTTIAKDSHSKILEKFKNEKIDVLVGTQMVSKGHDIENVTLVGVLGTDSMLNMNDYLASERAYSNISQVSGRAGRGSKEGRVIIETSDPENLVLNFACSNDYKGFYEKEINFRRIFEYPPFTDIVTIGLVSKNRKTLEYEADKLYSIFKNSSGLYKLFSPKVPFAEKINNKFRINMMLKTKIRKEVIDKIYANLNAYEAKASKSVSINITRNPTSI